MKRIAPSIKVILLAMAVSALVFVCVDEAKADISLSRIEGISFTTNKNEDILQIRLSSPRMPTISRYGMSNRVAITFENSQADSTLKNLLNKKSGGCVEHIETQMITRSADINISGGVRFKINPTDLVLIGYVQSDVETEIRYEDSDIFIHFYRIGQQPEQTRPVPMNYIKDIRFSRKGVHSIVNITTEQPITPSIYEELNPHRILLTFNTTYLPERAKNLIRSYMQTPGLFRVEGFNIGSQPKPYDEMDDSREYHFVGIPSPFAFNEFEEAGIGMQTRDTVI
ncbi:MAG TPA: hypothetical protein PLQ76_06725, partial [bacterium]|nr:hypothetical protein [bacterium]